MKKLLTIACTAAIAAGMMVSVSADDGDTEQLQGGTFPTPVYEDVELNTSNNEMNIPVFGYIGEDADITDPNPTDPTVPPVPEPTGTDMEISLPVKIMWAAFASDGGNITSPTYTIENKSAFAVDVELTSFTNTTSVEDRNSAIENGITISLTDLHSSAVDVAGSNTSLPLPAGTLSADTGDTPSMTFTVGGSYEGSFATQYQPTYEMVLTFSIH